MKPINSKERSKQVWQFILTFFGLAVVPIALIFFSYHVVPEKISEMEQEKLIKYSSFERNQKVLMKDLQEIDSNIALLANGSSNLLPEVLKQEISVGLSGLTQKDSSTFIRIVSKAYNSHLIHVAKMMEYKEEIASMKSSMEAMKEELKEAKSDLKDAEDKLEMYRMTSGMSGR